MGKHSSPKPGFAKQLVRDLTPASKRSAGRHSADVPSTATSVLATVRQRPVVAAIAVPAAATAAVVGSTVVMGPPDTGNVTTEAASTSQEQASPSAVSQDELDAQREEAGEEYLKDVKDDPKYKNKQSKTTLDVKSPKPKPSPTTEKAESESASGSESDSKSSGTKSSDDSSSDEKSSSKDDEKSSSKDKEASGGVSNEPCSVSSSIESGLLPSAVNGYRAVCAKFPEVKTYGGRRPGSGSSDHYTGEAVDIMITGSTGDRIAEYLIKNQGALNVKYVIWEQRIWNPGSGWESMENRGSPTDNHFDHVHVSFN